ncbi:tetratricopeptide repeat protein [bacterium]|nr:tetratricopeptide repeat protein [bacterium]
MIDIHYDRTIGRIIDCTLKIMDADIKYLIEQGKNFFKNQAYKKAEGFFLKVIASNREFADVYNMLGVIYHQSGEFSRAIESFEKALKINPNYTEALLNLSVLYNDLGEYRQAKQLVMKSKKMAAKSGDAIDPFVKGKLANKHAEVGDMYRGVGLYADAVNEYGRALRLAPHFYDIRNKMGICMREDGKKKEALSEFVRITKEKPTYAEAQIQLGISYYALGQVGDARKVWIKLSQENPKNQMVKTYLRLSEQAPKRAAPIMASKVKPSLVSKASKKVAPKKKKK